MEHPVTITRAPRTIRVSMLLFIEPPYMVLLLYTDSAHFVAKTALII